MSRRAAVFLVLALGTAAWLSGQTIEPPKGPSFLYTPPDLKAQIPSLKLAAAVDWRQGQFTLTITHPIPKEEAVAPVSRARTAKVITDNLPGWVYQHLGQLVLDSAQTVGEAMAARPETYQPFLDLVTAIEPRNGRVDSGYNLLTEDFVLPVFPGLTPLFHSQTEADDIPAILTWRPTRSFSGLVIYARGELPLGGTSLTARAERALFPRILGPDQDTLVDADRIQPEFLHRWGVAGYSDSLLEEDWRQRIGYDPLRVVAKAVYGRHACDLVLTQEDTDRLLADPVNRQNLAEGRILIILDPVPKESHE